MYRCTRQDNKKKMTLSLLRKAHYLLAQKKGLKHPQRASAAHKPDSLSRGAGYSPRRGQPRETRRASVEMQRTEPTCLTTCQQRREVRRGERVLLPWQAGGGTQNIRHDPGDGSHRLRPPRTFQRRGTGLHAGRAKAPLPSPSIRLLPSPPPGPGVTYQLPGPAQAGGTPPAASSFSFSNGGSK